MGTVVSNVIIIVVLAVIFFFAVKSSIAHFKGEGACCGGGSSMKLIKPKKLDTVTAVKVIRIGGMMCEHCAGRIHNALNSMEGVNAKVNRSKEQAVVKLGRAITEEELRRVITELGYTVVSVEDRG